jgi:lysozyme
LSQIDKPKLKVSRRGLELIKSFEGFRPRAERLADGRWVVGHGHTLSAREGAEVSAADAELLLQYDLLPILNAIGDRISLPLNQHQVDALASFGQAVGLERFLASDVLVWVNAGEPEDAARALIACDAPPLTPAPDPAVRRRAAESALFRQDPEQEADLATLMNAPVLTNAPVPEATGDASPEPEGDDANDARALAVAVLLGETSDVQDAGATPTPGPEADAPEADAPEAEAPVVAANENGADDNEVDAPPAPTPVDAAPASFAAAAALMAMQRYSPYAVPSGAVFQPLAETPAAPTEGPGEGQLILTPPPEVEREPPTREVWSENARPGPTVEEEPLFIDDPVVRAGGQPVYMPESFEPERRGGLDWNETGAFLGMGAVGLTAFGAAVVGFTMAADRPVHYGVDQTMVASGVLALIGALCVGISAYNLYLRWARSGED